MEIWSDNIYKFSFYKLLIVLKKIKLGLAGKQIH